MHFDYLTECYMYLWIPKSFIKVMILRNQEISEGLLKPFDNLIHNVRASCIQKAQEHSSGR